MPAETKQYQVRVWYDTPGARDGGLTFGTFEGREAAERCVIAVASRFDVKAAKIEEVV